MIFGNPFGLTMTRSVFSFFFLKKYVEAAGRQIQVDRAAEEGFLLQKGDRSLISHAQSITKFVKT